jgi:hypothetical protein
LSSLMYIFASVYYEREIYGFFYWRLWRHQFATYKLQLNHNLHLSCPELSNLTTRMLLHLQRSHINLSPRYSQGFKTLTGVTMKRSAATDSRSKTLFLTLNRNYMHSRKILHVPYASKSSTWKSRALSHVPVATR